MFYVTKNYHWSINPLSGNSPKWSNSLKLLPTNYFSLFDHFVGLAIKGLRIGVFKTLSSICEEFCCL